MKKFLTLVFAVLLYAFVGGMVSEISGFSYVFIITVVIAFIALIVFSMAIMGYIKLPRGLLTDGYIPVNLEDPGNNEGKGGDKDDKITLIRKKDVLVFPPRNSKGILMPGNIIMKPGCYAIDVYGTQDSIKASPKTEGGMDEKGVIQALEYSHPGISDEVLEHRTYWQNENIYAILHRCSTAKKHLYGAPCAILQMSWTCQDDKDATKTVFTLASAQKGPDIAVYQGTITYQEVTGTEAADATTVDVGNGEGQYQLTNGTAAAVVITTMDNAVDGNAYTLLGSGGSHPSTISGGDFILKNGTAWTAISGAIITFKAFQTGVATWKFIEQSRA